MSEFKIVLAELDALQSTVYQMDLATINRKIESIRDKIELFSSYRDGDNGDHDGYFIMDKVDEVVLYDEEDEDEKFAGGILCTGNDPLSVRKLYRENALVGQGIRSYIVRQPWAKKALAESKMDTSEEYFPSEDEDVEDVENVENYSDEFYHLNDELSKRASKNLPEKRVRKRTTMFDPSYNREADKAALRNVDVLGRDDTVLSNNDCDDLESSLDLLDGTDGSLFRFLRTGWGRKCLGDILEVCANNSGHQTASNQAPDIIKRYVKGVCEGNGTGTVWMKTPKNGTCCLCNRNRKVTTYIRINLEDQDEDFYAGRYCGQMLSALGDLAKMLRDGIPRGTDTEDYWNSVLNTQAAIQSAQKSKTIRKRHKA